ncbi:16S rRNA (cytosine(1402)-N(4))-methyltransferase RsmH [Nitrosophilus kaiyonis]|uniref:16S rRNA (cytosine(1402)-N(4))-methyltransferase RsmH n=1 Tax=Nitrosophilus kaiyonis TaxID=2930200 RepID=UPI0024900982|nr:16S rRNA (cytosine(1402)-N(4))-methyltransferase RsmH [Nitrosophilus kaiyonis]
MNIPHIPVLLNEVVDVFKDIKDGYIIDCTLGYGGHSEAILKSNPNVKIIGIDQDIEAIEFSKKRLESFKDRVKIVKGRFSQKIEELIKKYEIKGILADLGVSSLQLDKKERGFSFDSETLDMRMDKESSLSAYDVVNFYPKEKLEFIFKEYGEIRNYKKIADIIVKYREKNKITSPKELVKILEKYLPKNKKIHPATLVFQAIRIEVNQELKELENLLDILEKFRPSNAKVAIITFHSLEDRIVKNRFRNWAKGCICPSYAIKCECGGNNEIGKILTKKPIVATQEEILKNPRSRSAKLRVFQFR